MFQSSSTSTQSSRSLEQEGTYKYLEVSKGDRVQHSLKEKIRKEYYPRIRMVLKSELNSPTKLEAITTLAVLMVTYSFNIMNWTRNFLTKYKMHHPKSDIDRLYLPRTEGDRELIQQELSYKSTTIDLAKYLQETKDTLLHFVKDHDGRKPLSSISRQSMNNSYARRTKAKAKHQGCQQLRSKWVSKALHGKYPQRVKQAKVDHDKTRRWLKAAGLKAETEGFIIAPKIKASQHAGTNTSSSRSLTWTQNVDCVADSTRPFPDETIAH